MLYVVIARHSDVQHLMMSYPCHTPYIFIVTLESLALADITVLARAGAMVSIAVPGKGCFELSLLLG